MDSGSDPRHSVCGIIPPHLLQRIARAEQDAGENGTEHDAGESGVERDAAARTLAISRQAARGREVRAVRTRRAGLPGPATGSATGLATGPAPGPATGAATEPATGPATGSAPGLIPPHLQQRLRGPLRGGELSPDAALRAERARREGVSAAGPAAAAESATPHRSIHDAQHGTALPGTLVRAEGQEPTGDASADEAYDGLGATWELFHQAFSRNSLDDAGMELLATVHYGEGFQNAFWDGEQMIFGDGDGQYFRSFTSAVDVIGHELTHGVVQFTAGLIYVAQPGALHESIADCFGAMVTQRLLGQSAEEADWLIGEGLFTERVQGVALRSMKAPGTAYDDPVLGKDPQPDSMARYADLPHDEENDNGGVHINSGIPNRAFYVAATGIGGATHEGAGPIWYDALTRGGLPKDADFRTFAAATLAAAAQRHGEGSAPHRAVEEAWRTVGVLDAPPEAADPGEPVEQDDPGEPVGRVGLVAAVGGVGPVGEAVCWLDRLCPECGAMPEGEGAEDPRVPCWRCGAVRDQVPPSAPESPGGA